MEEGFSREMLIKVIFTKLFMGLGAFLKLLGAGTRPKIKQTPPQNAQIDRPVRPSVVQATAQIASG